MGRGEGGRRIQGREGKGKRVVGGRPRGVKKEVCPWWSSLPERGVRRTL